MRRPALARGTRRTLAWIVFGLALVLLVGATVATWARWQALDSERWADSSGALLADDDVRAAVAARIVAAAFDDPGAERRIAELLPPRFDPLAGQAVALTRQVATSTTENLLGTSAARNQWREANHVAHQRFIALIDDEPAAGLSTANGDVVLDLSPLVARAEARIGLDPSPALEGRAQVTILRAEQLESAREIVGLMRTLSFVLAVATVVMLALGIYLAAGFRRTYLAALAGGLVVAGLLLLALRRLAGERIVDSLTDPANQSAGLAIWDIQTDLLRNMAFDVVALGLLLLIGLWLSGASPSAVALRRWLAPFARLHPLAVQGIAIAAILAYLAIGPAPGGGNIVPVLILVLAALAGLEALRRKIVSENPDPAAPEPA